MINPDWSFTYPDEGNQRKAYRINFPGLYVYLVEYLEYFPVRDISASGVAFANASQHFREKERLEIGIYLDTELILDKIEARVVRIEKKVVSLQFENLSKREEYALDKLVLDIQKMQIERSKGTQE